MLHETFKRPEPDLEPASRHADSEPVEEQKIDTRPIKLATFEC